MLLFDVEVCVPVEHSHLTALFQKNAAMLSLVLAEVMIINM